ncbi:MAG: hydantoinase/carbamoylase family amidase, partial [Planctomycetota bacterium]
RLAPAEAAALVDGEGVSFEERRGVLGVAGDLSSVRLPTDAYHAFIELHIEQAPLLEQSGVPIGAVSHIAAPAALRVEYRGEGGHAGAVLMPDRRDALLPAAELALAVRSAAGQLGGEDTVATTGVLEVHPGAVNSIPSRARLEIDIRDTDHQRRDRVLAQIESDAHAIGARHSQRSTIDRVNADPPATCATQVVEAVEEASDDSGLACSRMVSRAYHDSLFMAQVAPTGMIFIPCRGGVSHRPDEYASPEAIGAGVAVLAGVLRRLAG